MTAEGESAARRFIESLSQAAREHRSLEALAADVDGFSQAVDQTPVALGEVLRFVEGSPGGPASLRSAAFASAACDRAGRVIAADAAFRTWTIGPEALLDAVRRLRAGQPRVSALVDEADGRRIAVAVAPGLAARDWPLDAPVRQALDTGAASYAVLAVRPPASAWSRVAAAYGLTGLEARVAAALSRVGDLRRAAVSAGVAYETAREAIAGAMAKTGARRQPELIAQLTTLASGDIAAGEDGWRTLADMFDLTARQAKLGWSIGHGATRSEAAQAAGVSEHAAKTDLRTVYAACGVSDAADLGRLAGEIEALSALATATDIQWSRQAVGDAAAAPLRFVRRRRAPGRIAVEDHGPEGGTPVVVAHSPTSGRRLPGVLVRALHNAGLRPISVERPGYGLTTPAQDDQWPLHEAAADLVDVLDALGLARVRLLGRGCIAALSFAALHAERFESGVLLGPSTPDPDLRRRDGLLGAVVSLVLERPHLVRGFASMLIRGSTATHIRQLTRAIARHSPADLAALDDPEILADHVRACQQAALGARGFQSEISHFAGGSAMTFAQSGRPWTILIGEHDPMLRTENLHSAWEAVLPGARVDVIEGAGRLPHLSHPATIAAALAR